MIVRFGETFLIALVVFCSHILFAVCGSVLVPMHLEASVVGLNYTETFVQNESDIVFHWEACEFCDGYEVNLTLIPFLGNRSVFPFTLRQKTVSLKFSNIAQKTSFDFSMKLIPDEGSLSRIDGKTKSALFPLQVTDLSVQPSNESLKFSWKPVVSDGFSLEFLDEAGTSLKKVDVKENHYEFTKLNPNRQYRMNILSYFHPKSPGTSSAVTSSSVRTLPSELPRITVRAERKDGKSFELSWQNPTWPLPIDHTLDCGPHGSLVLGGSSTSVTLSLWDNPQILGCWLFTRYGLSLPAVQSDKIELKNPDCDPRIHHYGYYDREAAEEPTLTERFSEYGYNEIHLDFKNTRTAYQFCEENTCGAWLDSERALVWSSVGSALKPWKSYTLKYRSMYSCEDIRSLVLPILRVEVPAVKNLQIHDRVLSWTHPDDSNDAPYILIAHCSSGICQDYSVLNGKNFFTFDDFSPSVLHYITVQAVREVHGKPTSSSLEKISFYIPKKGTEKLSVSIVKAENENPEVEVSISFEYDDKGLKVSSYHVTVCSAPIDLRSKTDMDFNGTVSKLEELSTHDTNVTCVQTKTLNTSMSVFRQPWRNYSLTVSPCFGIVDSPMRTTVVLPLLTTNPPPLVGLSWNADEKIISWIIHQAWLVTGFSINVCQISEERGVTTSCREIEATSADRKYDIDFSSSTSEQYKAFVSPFIKFGNKTYNGPMSELTFTNPR